MAKLIVGCGYLGDRVRRLWQAAGERVYAVTRSAERAEQWSREGTLPLVIDITQPILLPAPTDLESVLFAVGFDRRAGKSIHEVYVHGLARVLAWLPANVQRFVYISSTGVYGSFAGEWIDESSPCEPQREGGKACLAAEQLILASPFAERSVILRLAGIYGPERMPKVADLLAGKAIEADPGGYLNLIHVADAARIVLQADQQRDCSRCLLVSDGQPVLRGDYYAELARLAGAPPPTFKLPPSDGPPQRGSADKRVNNARLTRELQPQFGFADYRAGLAEAVNS